MDVAREFEARPPTRPLRTLADIVDDFAWRFPRTLRDPWTDYVDKSAHFEQAVYRACRSRDEGGRMCNHQTRVPSFVLERFASEILDRAERGLPTDDFDALHDALEEIRPRGIGPVTTYDVAYRLGYWLGIEPDSVYLHAGVRAGAQALGLPVRGRARIPLEDFPPPLDAMEANDVEDFLCTYRTVFPTLDRTAD